MFPNGRIVGGEDTVIETYPYQASLQYNGRHMCGASIISKNYLITAGHCIMNPTSALSVRVGSTYHSRGGSIHQVIKATRHENYKTNSAGVPVNDVAVLKVKQPFVFGDNVQPINLFSLNEVSNAGEKATITGWGTTSSGGSIPSQLQTVSIPIITKELCSEAYQRYGGLPDGQICAAYYGEGGKDACQGDSGGPLAIDGRLAGVVSWGNGCAQAYYPGAYTEVAYYREWIEKNAELA